jgi:predicted ATP-dependent serine protease
MFKKKPNKKYTCAECDSVVEIKVISNCPFCSDYLDDEDKNAKHEEGPLLKDFDDYDEFDEEKYYDDYEDDLDENDE